MYESSYPGISQNDASGENDPYLPIDILAVAAKLQCKPELLFGRLYYYLDAKHRYKKDNGSLVCLFILNLQGKRHSVHFPYLASILAGHDEEHQRQSRALVLSIIALILSTAGIVAQVLTE